MPFNPRYLHPYTKVQHARGTMDVDIDFSPVFNWNSNLAFVWVTAEYKTGKKEDTTTVTIWDDIIKRDEPKRHRVTFKEELFEYPLIDRHQSLG